MGPARRRIPDAGTRRRKKARPTPRERRVAEAPRGEGRLFVLRHARWRLPERPTVRLLVVGIAVVLLALWYYGPGTGRDLEREAAGLGRALRLWTAGPFAGILLSIALFPLLAPQFWARHYHRVAVGWAMAVALPFVMSHQQLAVYKIVEVLLIDYLPFLTLIWGLYTVSGGILLRGSLVGTPGVNTAMIAIGTVLASLMGTTGASMLLVRPLIRANAGRRRNAHVFVFFIFLVSNIGGVLTPLGDPPLFLGFLHGVPFFWTLELWPQALATAAIVLAVFYAVERAMYDTEMPGAHRGAPVPAHGHHTGRLRIEGGHNLLYLAGILGAVLLSGSWDAGRTGVYGVPVEHRNMVRDLTILSMGLLSVYTTKRYIREDNGFSWHAIREVGFLFFGIFMTIIPVLMILREGVHGAMGPVIAHVTAPWHYFWITGALSSFLDNAPTYLTFFNLALGQYGLSEATASAVLRGLSSDPAASSFAWSLRAISCGAVFMGANSYIGNAPNFMVLSIAQENGVKMPSFFGYMAWSAAVLIPSFLLVTWVFFR